LRNSARVSLPRIPCHATPRPALLRALASRRIPLRTDCCATPPSAARSPPWAEGVERGAGRQAAAWGAGEADPGASPLREMVQSGRAVGGWARAVSATRSGLFRSPVSEGGESASAPTGCRPSAVVASSAQPVERGGSSTRSPALLQHAPLAPPPQGYPLGPRVDFPTNADGHPWSYFPCSACTRATSSQTRTAPCWCRSHLPWLEPGSLTQTFFVCQLKRLPSFLPGPSVESSPAAESTEEAAEPEPIAVA
ncbi:unnamed protein product, partial [Closterium sp. Naga37s-1]